MSGDTVQSRVVLVTGAAGGLGRELVAEFAAQGWRVAAAWHQQPFGDPRSDSIQPVQLDVTNRANVEAVVDEILRRWGQIDVLVNNAGMTADALVSRMTLENWDHALDANLKGAFLCSQAVLRPMMKQRDGHIINLSSHSALAGTAGQSNYAAAKAGLIGLTQSLAREMGGRNVRVNAVLPGVLPTPMTQSLSANTLTQFATANALGRINDLSEVARFIVFLAGMRNASGQVFQLDSRIRAWT